MNTNLDERDWRVIYDLAKHDLAKFDQPSHQEIWTRGRNFMTPELLGWVKISGHVIEVSTGMFLSDRIFGVSYRSESDARSRCLFSWAEVMEYLESLREDDSDSGKWKVSFTRPPKDDSTYQSILDDMEVPADDPLREAGGLL